MHHYPVQLVNPEDRESKEKALENCKNMWVADYTPPTVISISQFDRTRQSKTLYISVKITGNNHSG